jgi:hypothetical protein
MLLLLHMESVFADGTLERLLGTVSFLEAFPPKDVPNWNGDTHTEKRYQYTHDSS